MAEILIGKNSIVEAIKAGRQINKIIIEANKRHAGISELLELAKERKIKIDYADSQTLARSCDTSHHQGLVAFVSPVVYADIDDVLNNKQWKSRYPLIVLLNEVQDPHNFGAIIRSCEAAGADAIVITQRHCCPVNETVSRASSGAVEHIPIIMAGNLVQLIERLKQAGFWIAGADMEGESIWCDSNRYDYPLALIIGGENKGLGKLVKSTCDFLLSIPMNGKVNSLNASVAAAIVVFEIIRRRNSDI